MLQQPYGLKSFQISGPSWISTERFDIAATYAANPSLEDFRAMIRTMLADRFGLKLHHEAGLDGAFNFETTFACDNVSPVPSSYPSLFNALEYDLGLQLEKSKVPMDTVVIDHVDRSPTEN